MNKQFEQQEEEVKRSGLKETLAVLMLILSAIAFLVLITKSAILGDFGEAFSKVLLGIFGFSSYIFSAAILAASVMMLFVNKAKGRGLLIFSLSLIVFAAMIALEIWTSNSVLIRAQGFTFTEFIEHTYNLNGLGIYGSSCGGAIMSAIIYFPVRFLSVGGAYALAAIVFIGGSLGIFSDVRKRMLKGGANKPRANQKKNGNLYQNNQYGNPYAGAYGDNFRANKVNLGDKLSDLPYQQTVMTDFNGNNLFNQNGQQNPINWQYPPQGQYTNDPYAQKPDARSILYPQYNQNPQAPQATQQDNADYGQNEPGLYDESIFDRDNNKKNGKLFIYNASKDNHLKEKSRREVKEDKQRKAKDLLYPEKDEESGVFSVNSYNRPKDLSRNRNEEKRVTNESLDDIFNKNFGKENRAISSDDYSERRIDLVNKPNENIPSNIIGSQSDDFRTKRLRNYEDDQPIERPSKRDDLYSDDIEDKAEIISEKPVQKPKPIDNSDDGFRIIKPKTMPKIFTLADVKKDDSAEKSEPEKTDETTPDKISITTPKEGPHYSKEDYENNTKEFKDLLASGKIHETAIDLSNIQDYDYTKTMPKDPSKIKILTSVEQVGGKKPQEEQKSSFDLLNMLKDASDRSNEKEEISPVHNDEANDLDGILSGIRLDDDFDRQDAKVIFSDTLDSEKEDSSSYNVNAESHERDLKDFVMSDGVRDDQNDIYNYDEIKGTSVAGSNFYQVKEPKIIKTTTGTTASQLPIIAKAEQPTPQPQKPTENSSDKPFVRVPYNRPPIDFLAKSSQEAEDNSQELEEKSKKLEKILASFDIGAKVVDIVVGPVVTRFELEIEEGTSVKRVEQYSKDITMGLESPSEVIIQAPIPGKNRFGVEVPNKKRTKVMMRDLVESDIFTNHKSSVVFALGKDVAGKMMYCDIKKMPHLLVAGSTGTGKSVCLNTILISILYHSSPEDVRIILVDPKRVEFNVYSGLPHLLINELINDSAKAISALDWAIAEMERRFTLFQNSRARDLDSYNETLYLSTQKKLPRIVIIVDEVADLMSDNKRELEDRIKRLAAKARAAGIHLVLATQRPSVDVITGVIKANLPSRIALKVANGIDSKTILDETGAERLLGYGDMFYKPLDFPDKVRVQGCLVETEEVINIVNYVIAHNPADFDEEAMKAINAPKNQPEEVVDAQSNTTIDPTQDEYLKEFVRMAIERKQISVSMIQRSKPIGYAKAGRYIDTMEKLGYISPFNGSKPREVYITKEQFEQEFGEEY